MTAVDGRGLQPRHVGMTITADRVDLLRGSGALVIMADIHQQEDWRQEQWYIDFMAATPTFMAEQAVFAKIAVEERRCAATRKIVFQQLPELAEEGRSQAILSQA